MALHGATRADFRPCPQCRLERRDFRGVAVARLIHAADHAGRPLLRADPEALPRSGSRIGEGAPTLNPRMVGARLRTREHALTLAVGAAEHQVLARAV